jgi:hypothetical protein
VTPPTVVISLDLELSWGSFDRGRIADVKRWHAGRTTSACPAFRYFSKAFPRGLIYVIDFNLAAPQGFEPRYADPESAVLPLNEGAAMNRYWI